MGGKLLKIFFFILMLVIWIKFKMIYKYLFGSLFLGYVGIIEKKKVYYCVY